MILAFGEFELDDARCELRRGEGPVELQKKPFELLSYLIHHRDRAVPRDELFDEVWSDTLVSDSALTSALRDVRRTLGDDGRSQTWIRTWRGRGVRFVGEVEVRRPRPEGRVGPALIGRTEPLARLEAALDDAVLRRCRTVLLAGAAGIGKTRLAQEAARRAERLGFRALWGRCWDGDGAPPFWPWTGILRAGLGEKPAATLAETLGARAPWIAHLLPELRGELTPPPVSDSPGARFQLFDAVAALLRSLAAATPLVVIVDDLHWGDVASLELLRFLSMHLSDGRVVLVGTVRDGELPDGDPRGSLLADFARDDAFEEIQLGGLSKEDCAALVAQLVEHDPDPGFVGRLRERTRGNPLFIGETLRHLEASVGEGERSSRWTRTVSLDAAGLAEGVRHVIERRLQGLGDDCRELLEVASVVGSEFDLELLERVATLGGHEVPALMDEAAAAHVIEPHPQQGGWTFRHPLIRETLVAGLGLARRRALHLAVGEACEAVRGADAEPPFAILSDHFEQAGSAAALEKAFSYAVLAARRSRDRYAREDAIRQFGRALRLQERGGSADPKLRCDLLVELAHTENDAERAAQAGGRAFELARSLDAPELLAKAASVEAGAHWGLGREPFAPRMARLQEAIDALGERDLALRARLLARFAFCATEAGDGSARAVSQEALSAARRSGDPEEIAYALGARHYSLWRPENLEVRRALAREARGASSDPWAVNLAGEWQLLDALREGDLEAAGEALERQADATAVFLDPFHAGLARIHHGTLDLLQGRLAEAEAVGARELGRAAERGSASGRTQAQGLVSGARFLQGRLGELLPALLAQRNRAISHPRVFDALLLLARLEAGTENHAAARLARLSEPLPEDHDEPIRLGILAEVCRRLCEPDAAERLTGQLRPYLPQHLVSQAGHFGGSSCHWMGVLAAVRGHHDEALELYEQALDGYRALEARPWIAWTEEASARSLLVRGRPGDRAAATTLLDQSLATARELGLQGLEARLREPARPAGD